MASCVLHSAILTSWARAALLRRLSVPLRKGDFLHIAQLHALVQTLIRLTVDLPYRNGRRLFFSAQYAPICLQVFSSPSATRSQYTASERLNAETVQPPKGLHHSYIKNYFLISSLAMSGPFFIQFVMRCGSRRRSIWNNSSRRGCCGRPCRRCSARGSHRRRRRKRRHG